MLTCVDDQKEVGCVNDHVNWAQRFGCVGFRTFLEDASDGPAHVDNRVGCVVSVDDAVVWGVWI